MKRSIPGFKNDNGSYIKVPTLQEIVKPVLSDSPSPDVSLDDIGKRIIVAMDRATKTLLESITAGDVSREIIGALKDCQTMYKDLRKDEKDLLASMSDEDIDKMLTK